MAQNTTVFVSGTVTDATGIPLHDAYVYIKGSTTYTVTNVEGKYKLEIPVGEFYLTCELMGYATVSEKINASQHFQKHFKLQQDSSTQLDEVELVGKTAIQQVRETPFNVVALDAGEVKHTTMNLGNLLNRASGVKMRESGGMGSQMNMTLNGFTGRRVRVFMDGVPMEGFGNAFQLNNIPVSLASRIEVYKGVVPVEFGGDAIGGAINIVTNQKANTYADVSYAFGSFNSHRFNTSVGYTNKNGFSFLVNGFVNYSDNDYKVQLDKMLDVETGTYIRGDYTVRRFHDQYRNQTVMAKAGFVNKWWADRFYLGLTAGNLDADVQNASTLEIVYGARTRSAASVLPSLEYYKKNLGVKNLNLRITGNYNYTNNKNVDTVARLYNWYGDYMPTRTKGESGTNVLSDFVNTNYSATANATYEINKNHSIVLNNVVSGYNRKVSSDVPLDELTSAADTMQRASTKNVVGLSYNYRKSKKWHANLFAKHYYQHVLGPVDTSTVANNNYYIEDDRSFTTTGYGVAITRHLKGDIQLKASYEKAYRLPSDQELFGDELLTSSNSGLRAENSNNFNLGISMNKQLPNNNVLYADVNTYYRLNKDFIQQVQNARYGTIGNVNFGRVQNIGVDAELRYYHGNNFMLGGTVTYMELRNKEKMRDAASSVSAPTYNDRMPNIPYFFGNADAAYYLHDVGRKGNTLSLNYNFNFVGEFYLLWESQGNSNTKATLPEQIYHDFSVNYTMKNGRYNISLEALNFTDAMLYDNFSLQKPGRSFNIKLRYYWNKAI
ncbi:TonB-dependent receptor [Formosa sp. S-31]|uniref:TonB-dependent receptor n=1 Tax=Formosa sp. S-31 TaxID=2790949 RepID=UPI003EBF81B1